MIFEQTYNLLKNLYGNKLKELIISDVRIGLYLTAVRLSDNSIGTSATLGDGHLFRAKGNRDFGEFTPLKIKGLRVTDILEKQKVSGTISSIKTAVLSAVSSNILLSGKYNVIDNTDPMQLLDLNPLKTVTIVGAFQSYIRKISQTGNKLHVLELNKNALSPEQKNFFVPAGDFNKILPVSDIVIITGQTLVNGTIDDLLSMIKKGAQVVVTGPSSSIIPDILFDNGVSIIGAVRITNPELLFEIVSEGGTGFHLIEYCATKICILK